MKGTRRFSTWLVIAAVPIATGCGPKRVASPAKPGQDLVVLLPDSDTRATGSASVSNSFGLINLAAEGDAAIVAANRGPVLTKLSAADVTRIFGDALSALPPAPRRFTVYFRFESDVLTEQSQTLIPEILAAVRAHAVQDVAVVGHTDTTGTQQTNYGLGLKRAMMVRNILVKAGLSGSSIDVTSVGELDPFVKTRDDTPEPRNRRVEIVVR